MQSLLLVSFFMVVNQNAQLEQLSIGKDYFGSQFQRGAPHIQTIIVSKQSNDKKKEILITLIRAVHIVYVY